MRLDPAAPDLRIVADDLTGALDTAAQFTGLGGGVPVLLRPGEWGQSAALDSGLRDAPPEIAVLGRSALVEFLAPAKLAYLKIDSLLRGHALSDVAGIYRLGGYHRCILAPAFPAQGRVTRGGVQSMRSADGTWRPVGPSLVAALRAEGAAARLARSPDEFSGEGIVVCDAESEAELNAIAEAGLRLEAAAGGRVLWCGTAGLARALAGRPPSAFVGGMSPLLAIIGSIHPRSRAQLQAVADSGAGEVIEIGEDGACDADAVSTLLATRGAAVLGFRFAPDLAAAEAMRRIRGLLGGLLPLIRRPAALLVSGGETLRAACEALQARRLLVSGELQPGLPAARLVGGIWDAMTVISKSGAFGDAATLADMVLGRCAMPPLLGESA